MAAALTRRARFYLPGSSSLRWGGWVGVCLDGRETVDFGLRREAEDCAEFFDRVISGPRADRTQPARGEFGGSGREIA